MGWPPGVQPGGRDPAPGDLGLVQAFVNSHYDLERDHGADLFATVASSREWLRRHGLLDSELAHIDPRDRRRAVSVREALRTLARANTDSVGPHFRVALATLNDAARGAAVEVRFTADGAGFARSEPGGMDAALGVLLAITATAMRDRSWSRLKVCPGEHCGWAFYDHSRNQAGRWCSMAVCGGRAKARAHYLRRRAEGN
jgi:predicted RNA-binding Zn ribbon-like protein